jgi:hypothetical protein
MQYTTEDTRRELPDTDRGRALHTIDWFLNGVPTSNCHDSMQYTVDDCFHG